MSRAFAFDQPRVSLWATAAIPLPGPAFTASACRVARVVARLGGLLLGSAAAAAVIWMTVAGPGFVSGRSSTVGPGHVRTAAR